MPCSRIAFLTMALLSPSCGTPSQTSELVQPPEWWRVHPRPGYASLEKVGTYQEWFDVYKLAEGTWAIYEPNQFEEAISYLLAGEERAVLVDTGTGIGNIRAVTEQLTKLPVSVVNTHEHYDHVGGNHLFAEVAVCDNASALAVLAAGVENSQLLGYVSNEDLWKPLPGGLDKRTWTIPPLEPTTLLHDGEVIDLGGRQLEVIETPGHSPGSICLLDPHRRLLLTGDQGLRRYRFDGFDILVRSQMLE